MRVAGYEPLTLIDYPGKLAAIVFTPGCALHCPYCHNPELIEAHQKDDPFFRINHEKEFFAFLEKRHGKLDGVVITGGEPTLHADLLDFIEKVKSIGFLVKLDTNGIFPDIVETVMKTGLVDYWAMDIKHTPEKYHLASGLPAEALAPGGRTPLKNFQRSVQLIMDSGVPYEFRTTVVPGIHEEEDFRLIGEWIRGARAYYLQRYRDIKINDPNLPNITQGRTIDLERVRSILAPYLDTVGVRD